MKLTEEKQNGILVISLDGRLDVSSSESVLSTLEPRIVEGTRLLLDLSALHYVSSAGLRVVLQLAQKAKEQQGQMVLCGLSDNVMKVFEVSGFDRILKLCPDRDQALAALR